MLATFVLSAFLVATQPKKLKPVEYSGTSTAQLLKPAPKPLEAPKLAEVQEVAPPAPKPAIGSYNGSGDENLDWIIARESGGNPYAMNPSGACGLPQALPCSKLLNACGSLDNVGCQIEWMRNYCVSVYGSTYQARVFWSAHSYY